MTIANNVSTRLQEAAPAGSPRRRVSPILLLLAIAACLFFVGLGRLPLVEPDEGRNAEVAREMLAKGDWIVPHFDGFAYLDKPPVFFWLAAASFKLGGISEASARFSSALAALGTMLLVWFLARRMFGDSAGFYAGIIFATAPLTLIFARIVIFDMTLTFFVTAAMVCYWLGESSARGRKLWDILFFAAMGAATLTKGPVGFLLPVLSIVAYQAWRGNLRRLRELNWALGLAAFLAVTLPWFLAVTLRHPDFPRYAFWQESLERFATGNSHRAGPLYYYLPIYLAGFLPWSFFLLYAAYHRVRRWRELRQDVHAPVLFLLSWVGVIFIFFTISRSKLPGYFLPAVIPLSILMAKVWTEKQGNVRAPDWLVAGFATLLALGILAVIAPQLERFASLHARLAGKAPSDVLPLVGPSLIYTGIILGALGVIGRNLCARAGAKAPTLTILLLAACTFPLILARWLRPLELYASADSSRSLAETMLSSPERNLPVYGFGYFRTSLPFYLRRPVGLISETADELTSNYIISRWPKASVRGQVSSQPGNIFAAGEGRRPLVMDENAWLAERRSTPVLVMIQNRQVPELAAAVREMNPLWSGWKYSVWEIPAESSENIPPARSSSR
jgi:4-amino-4-deoxy-L-arabinose transferase-like glycosyltransferase